jgi:hypothetical protein
MSHRSNATPTAEFAELESLLQATLQPKMPRPGYGSDLQRRLSNQSAPTLEVPRQDEPWAWLLIAALLAMVLIILGVKILIDIRRDARP